MASPTSSRHPRTLFSTAARVASAAAAEVGGGSTVLLMKRSLTAYTTPSTMPQAQPHAACIALVSMSGPGPPWAAAPAGVRAAEDACHAGSPSSSLT